MVGNPPAIQRKETAGQAPRKKEVNELRRRSTELSAILNSVSEGLIVLGPAGVVSMNAAAVKLGAFESLEQAKNFCRRISPASATLLDLDGRPIPFEHWPISRAKRREPFRDYEAEVIDPRDGRRWRGLFHGQRVLDEQGRDTGLFLTAVRDVTSERKTERALRESEARLCLAIDAAKLGVFEVDLRSGRMIWGNQQMYEILGRTREDGPIDPAEFMENASLPDGDQPGENRKIVRIRRQDGTLRWVESAHLYDAARDGTPLRLIGTQKDVTEQKRLEEERERAERLKDDFLAALGHELRNPLAALAAAVQMVGGAADHQSRASLADLMGRQIAVLRRQVDDLLEVARIAHGQVGLNKERVELARCLESAVFAAQSVISQRKHQLILMLPAEPVCLLADEVRLEQVLTNLLDNAAKYTSPGGRIELSAGREGREAVIRCKDNGCGIAPEMQKDVFRPFVRGHRPPDSAEGGVGIGLALAASLVEMHGGTLSVSSEGAGKGSEFTVRLPALKGSVSRAKNASVRRAPSLKGPRPLTIALVDDNADVAWSLSAALGDAGHRVRIFTDSHTALSGAARLKPDAVLIDIGLPGRDGYQLASELRKKKSLRRAAFIAISGFPREADAGRPRGDFDHYFMKPVDRECLLAALDAHAGASATDAGLYRTLLVEDSADVAAMTAQFLKTNGCEVKVACSGSEALVLAQSFQPEIVFCDLKLADMSGTEVVRCLRQGKTTSGAVIVMLTALAEPEIRTYQRDAGRLGLDLMLAKPLTEQKFRSVLEKRKTRMKGLLTSSW